MRYWLRDSTFAGPIDLFSVDSPTHAIVDFKSDVNTAGGADTLNTFDTGYIYNVFGATNPGVESNHDMIFADDTTTDYIDFHTVTPVNIYSVALAVGSESALSDGPRGFLTATFQEYSDVSYSTAVGPVFNFSATFPSGVPQSIPVSIIGGQYFALTMTVNQPYVGNTEPTTNGGGVRVYSLTAVPEPSSVALCALGAGGLLLAAVRRKRRAIGGSIC